MQPITFSSLLHLALFVSIFSDHFLCSASGDDTKQGIHCIQDPVAVANEPVAVIQDPVIVGDLDIDGEVEQETACQKAVCKRGWVSSDPTVVLF